MKSLPCKTILFCALISLSALAAAQPPPPNPEVQIREVMAEAEAAWNEGDLEGYMNCYWRSEELCFVGGDRISRGWQPVLDGYLRAYPDQKTMGQLTFSELEIQLVASDAALVLGRWALAREEVGEGKDTNPHGVFTLMMKRLAEGWRIVHDHTSAADSD